MKTSHLIQSSALALCADQGAEVPEWIQLTPPGPVLTGRDGRAWSLRDPQAICRAYAEAAAQGIEAPIDFEHATHIKGEAGEAAPAVGWLKELEARDGALWGRVDWLDAGRNAIASKGYRYVSPGFRHNQTTGEVTRLVSVGLTNVPNFAMPALNRAAAEEYVMDPAVLKVLGLPETATAEDVVAAIDALKTAEATALNRATTPDPASWVPRADHELALNRISALEADDRQRLEQQAVDAVDAAIAAGKVSPASRDYHLATCRAEAGLERFNSFIALQPVIAPPSQLGPRSLAGGGAYSEEELAVCRQFGMDPAEVFGAGKKE